MEDSTVHMQPPASSVDLWLPSWTFAWRARTSSIPHTEMEFNPLCDFVQQPVINQCSSSINTEGNSGGSGQKSSRLCCRYLLRFRNWVMLNSVLHQSNVKMTKRKEFAHVKAKLPGRSFSSLTGPKWSVRDKKGETLPPWYSCSTIDWCVMKFQPSWSFYSGDISAPELWEWLRRQRWRMLGWYQSGHSNKLMNLTSGTDICSRVVGSLEREDTESMIWEKSAGVTSEYDGHDVTCIKNSGTLYEIQVSWVPLNEKIQLQLIHSCFKCQFALRWISVDEQLWGLMWSKGSAVCCCLLLFPTFTQQTCTHPQSHFYSATK